MEENKDLLTNDNVSDVNENLENDGTMQFKFADQVGPLDLLLFLIKKNKLEIEEVKLADITDQYLEMIQGIDKLDLDTASDFIVMAAELIEIKSKSLLPSIREDQEEEEDPEELLKMRLKEYELMKEMSEKLKEVEITEVFYKAPEPEAGKYRVVIKDMQLDALLDAFTKFMLKNVKKEAENTEVKQVEKEKYTVEQKIATIKDSLIMHKKIRFSQLLSTTISKNEIVTTFMALLELLKLQTIKVKQDNLFEDIEIVKVEEEDE
ncbi:MAG: segregation/condensation protein A [Clostridia bacterium]|nr:segregation/condensation protein A [Clostridia bacterium]